MRPDPLALLAEAVRRHQQGRLTEAVGLYRRILAQDARQAHARHLLGVALHQTGRAAEGLQEIDAAIALDGRQADFFSNRGTVLRALGRDAEALAAFDAALERHPAHGDALFNRMALLRALQRHAEARATGLALLHHPHPVPAALNELGLACKALGRHAEALEAFARSIQADPNAFQPFSNMASSLRELGRHAEAVDCCRQALARQPELAGLWCNLAVPLTSLGRIDQALAALDRAAALGGRSGGGVPEPSAADLLNNRAHALVIVGRYPEARAAREQALVLEPDFEQTRGLLHLLLYLPDLDPEELFTLNRERMAACRTAIPVRPAPPRRRLAAGQRLRVGYVSSDFFDHPVGGNLIGLLEHHDHSRCEIFCYAEERRVDAFTERFRAAADHWIPTNGLTDAQAAARIRADGIDILVFLAGHHDRNRLLLAAHRPAPIQISFHDATTSGLEEMDYWLTDRTIRPPGSRERLTETPVYLPVFYNYPVLGEAPAVGESPVKANGFVTFGSFNHPAKINHRVIELWARILTALPDARLLLKYQTLLEPGNSASERLLAAFEHQGVARERIKLLHGFATLPEHLDQYRRMDLALDPFPYTGATTTFQALWMGVPTVTLAGPGFIGRMAAAILVPAGLEELVAPDLDAYVAKAVALARDHATLARLRRELRPRVAASPLCDAPGYARSVEQAFLNLLDGGDLPPPSADDSRRGTAALPLATP
ncbi:MAG: tetratricopeptide repeat protein [Magnetococcales bacterium]|nr:tetratricopeptide repeat protein [Magnetococcales bacterium]